MAPQDGAATGQNFGRGPSSIYVQRRVSAKHSRAQRQRAVRLGSVRVTGPKALYEIIGELLLLGSLAPRLAPFGGDPFLVAVNVLEVAVRGAASSLHHRRTVSDAIALHIWRHTGGTLRSAIDFAGHIDGL